MEFLKIKFILVRKFTYLQNLNQIFPNLPPRFIKESILGLELEALHQNWGSISTLTPATAGVFSDHNMATLPVYAEIRVKTRPI